MAFDVSSVDEPGRIPQRISVLEDFFDGNEDKLDWKEKKNSDWFVYGYALTVHKSQGSQWDNVMLFDEGYAFRENWARWTYTGITRAAETITIVRQRNG